MLSIDKIYKLFLTFLLVSPLLLRNLQGQPVPGLDENIEFLVTFGKDGETSWGDDDFSQTWFFAIPKEYKGKFYIRVFDPDTGGENDEGKGPWDTKMQYTLWGGKGVDPEKNLESRGIDPIGGYKSGTMLATKVFSNERQYDNKSYTFGPFNPAEGELSEKWGYIFKFICDGISGDDGNLYKYFLSREPNSDVPIEGANAFTYEYTFRMWNKIESVAHIYPYIDTGIVYVVSWNFDWDDDGTILAASTVRKATSIPISPENKWVEFKFSIESEEIGKSLDFQFHKKKEFLVRNNNVVVRLENQRGDNLKFFSSPIGGVPVYDAAWKYRKLPPPPKK
jgi:hypothetical protein